MAAGRAGDVGAAVVAGAGVVVARRVEQRLEGSHVRGVADPGEKAALLDLELAFMAPAGGQVGNGIAHQWVSSPWRTTPITMPSTCMSLFFR